MEKKYKDDNSRNNPFISVKSDILGPEKNPFISISPTNPATQSIGTSKPATQSIGTSKPVTQSTGTYKPTSSWEPGTKVWQSKSDLPTYTNPNTQKLSANPFPDRNEVLSVPDPASKPTQERSIWNRIAKTVLPRKAEDFFGLNDPKEVPVRQNIMDKEKAKQDYWEQKRIEEASWQKDKKKMEDDWLKENTRGLPQNLAEEFRRGNESQKIDIAAFDVMTSKNGEGYDEILARRNNLNNLIESDPLEYGNWLTSTAGDVSEMLPAMGAGTWQGTKWGGAAAGGAAVLGQVGPQVAIPEEIITMPAAFGYAFKAGSMDYWYKQGAGSIYMELRDNGIDHELSKNIASVAGIPYAAIEFLQVSKLIPKGKDVVRGALKRTVGSMVKKYGTDWIKNVGEEGLQEVVQAFSVELARDMDKQVEGNNVATAAWNIAKRSMNTMIQSAGPMAILSAGSGIVTESGSVNKTVDAVKRGEIGLSIKDVFAPLAQEALKYDSAEEFVKAQSTLPTERFTGTTGIATGKTDKIFNGNELESPQSLGFTGETVAKKVGEIKSGKRPFVTIGKNGDQVVVIDGNHALAAYKELGIKDIPIIDKTGDNLIKTKSELTEIFNTAKKGEQELLQAECGNEMEPDFDEAGKPVYENRAPSTAPVQRTSGRQGSFFDEVYPDKQASIEKAEKETGFDPEEIKSAVSYDVVSKKKPLFNGKKTVAESPLTIKQQLQEKILRAKEEVFEEETSNENPPPLEEFPEEGKAMRRDMKNSGLLEVIPTLKDINHLMINYRDFWRNTYRVFKGYEATIDKVLLDPFRVAKNKNIEMQGALADELAENVPFGIKSKESADIQKYGEGLISREKLIDKYGEEKAAQIVKADTFFRKKYDQLIASLNKVEQSIYPTRPDKWTPTRENYYRHFQEVSNDYSRLQQILLNPVRIDPLLVGETETTKPLSRWSSIKQRRTGEKTKYDAVAGYIDYAQSVSYAINIDPQIGRIREFAKILERATSKTKNLNKYIENVENVANELSGKTPLLDRALMSITVGGRSGLKIAETVNRRIKKNTILGNVPSAAAQILNVPQGFSRAGALNSLVGYYKTLVGAFKENAPMKKSWFMKERFFKGFNQFDKRFIGKPLKMAGWMVNLLDEVGTKMIWNGQYELAKQKGVPDLVKYADNATRNLVAGRGIGEKPSIQNTQTFQLANPFTLEMTNVWYVMQDMAISEEKKLTKMKQFAFFFLADHLINNAFDWAFGTQPLLDPIEAFIDAWFTFEDEPNAIGATKAVGRLGGEALSNMPWGNVAATMFYPEYGNSVLPTRSQVFGKGDPTRYGDGILMSKGISDPLYKLFPPWGGGQLKKTIGGLKQYNEGKGTSKNGTFQYRVDQNPVNLFRSVIGGEYAVPEAQEYFNKRYNGGPSGNPFNKSSGSSSGGPGGNPFN